MAIHLIMELIWIQRTCLLCASLCFKGSKRKLPKQYGHKFAWLLRRFPGTMCNDVFISWGLCCNLFTYLVRTPVYRSCRTTHLIWWRPYQQQIVDNGRVRFVERRISSCWNEFKTTSHWLMLLHEMMNLKTLLLVMLCLECIFRVGLGARKAKEPNCEDGCHLRWNLKASSHTDIHTDVC